MLRFKVFLFSVTGLVFPWLSLTSEHYFSWHHEQSTQQDENGSFLIKGIMWPPCQSLSKVLNEAHFPNLLIYIYLCPDEIMSL